MISIIGRVVVFFRKLRVKRLISRFKSVGVDVDIQSDLQIFFSDRFSIGNYVYIGPNASINALGGVIFRDGVIIGPNLVLHSANHRYKDSTAIPYDEKFDFRPVEVQENVWIGSNVVITPGSFIGEGAIIGAGCVVSGSIPPLAIVVGNPAVVKKYRNSDHYYNLKQEGRLYLKLKKNGHGAMPDFEIY